MKCPWHACWIVLFTSSAMIAAAQDAAPTSTRSESEAAAPSTRAIDKSEHGCMCERSHGIEATLREAAGLEFAPDKPVTVGDILDQLHRQHGLSIRFDYPTFASLYGLGPQTPHPDSPHSETLTTEPPRTPKSIAPDTATTLPPGAVPPIHPASSRRTPEPVVRAQAPVATTSAAQAKESPAKPTATTANSETASTSASSEDVPASPVPPVPAPPPHVDSKSAELGCETFNSFLEHVLAIEVDVRHVDLRNVSVATALQVALEALPTPDLDDEGTGLPIPLTDASRFDFLAENDGVLITTRLQALTHKETRVYSVKHLKDISANQLATVIRQSVRPWSWRSRIDDIGEQLRASTAHVPAKALGSVLKAGYQMAADATGVSLASDQSDEKCGAKKEAADLSDAEAAEMLGNAVVNGLVTFAHTTLTALEIAHYADPPTGSIQTLPGKLIITQSQAAHREIADLLKQLGDE